MSNNSHDNNSLCLYIIREANPKDNWVIQAHFDEKVKFNFERHDVFNLSQKKDKTNHIHPYIFELKLNFKQYEDGKIDLKHENQFHSMNRYKLRISANRYLISKSHFWDDTDRCILENLQYRQYFIFDAPFSSDFKEIPVPGSNINTLDQLCLFTYFIIISERFDLWDPMAKQFLATGISNKISSGEILSFYTECYRYIDKIQTNGARNVDALKVLVKMNSLFSVEAKKLRSPSNSVGKFILEIYEFLSSIEEKFFNSISKDEWSDIENGLIKLFGIGLATLLKDEIVAKSLNVYNWIADEDKRRRFTRQLIDVIKRMQYKAKGGDLIKLFSMIGWNMLLVDDLEIVRYINVCIICLEHIFEANPGKGQDLTLRARIIVENQASKQSYKIELNDIACILAYVKTPSDPKEDQQIKKNMAIADMLKECSILWQLIRQELSKMVSVIKIEEFKLIFEIFIINYNSTLLCEVNPQDFLKNMLICRREVSESNYLIQWFKMFLSQSLPVWMNCKELLSYWILSFTNDNIVFVEIMSHFDRLVEGWQNLAPEDQQHKNHFVIRMVELYFSKDLDYILKEITETLPSVQDQTFLNEFSKRFLEKISKHDTNEPTNYSMLKKILIDLVQYFNHNNRSSLFINQIIFDVSTTIKLRDDDVLNDAFYCPKEDFIYFVLFNETLRKCNLYIKVIDILQCQWLKWKNGILRDDIIKWSKFNVVQKRTIEKIWSHVIESSGNNDSFDMVFRQNEQQLARLLGVYDTAMKCLTSYCQTASDLKNYTDQFRAWYTDFGLKNVQLIQVPDSLSAIAAYGESLNPFSTVDCWQKYLNKSIVESTHREDHRHPKSEIESFTPIDGENLQNLTCLVLLEHSKRTFEKFLKEINGIYALREEKSIKIVLDFFPEIGEYDQDIRLLQTKFNPDVTNYLRNALSYWINRNHIKKLFDGLRWLSLHLKFNYEDDIHSLFVEINGNTTGATCAQMNEYYFTKLIASSSEKLVEFISYYGSSSSLFEFLLSLNDIDMDSLKEAANYRDEKLTDAQSIFDFANVKNFVDVVYKSLEQKKKMTKSNKLSIGEVILCFQDVWCDQRNIDLLHCVNSSLEALASIKHTHLNLTDQQQSKKRSILDIRENSSIEFFKQETDEVAFDVSLKLLNQENVPIPGKILHFTDLSELRDRARLLQYSTCLSTKGKDSSTNDNMTEILAEFVEFCRVVETYIEKLADLFTAGNFIVEKYLASFRNYSCKAGKYEDLRKDYDYICNLHADWDKSLCEKYTVCPHLTFLSGKEFWDLDDYCRTKSTKVDPGYHLARFMNIIHQNSRTKQSRENIEAIMAHCHRKSSLIDQVIVKSDGNRRKLEALIVETSDEGILRAVISLFKRTGTDLSLSNIFYCSSTTTWFQLRAFLFRSFFSESLQQLIRPELLTQSIQDQFICFLKILINQHPNQRMHMSIITTVSTKQQFIVEGMQVMEIARILSDNDLMKPEDYQNLLEDMLKSHRLYTSRIAGLGKTSLIREDIKNLKKEYVKYPINDFIDINVLTKDIRSLNLVLKDAILHIDIGIVRNPQRLNQILYCLLLFGGLRFAHGAAYLPYNTPIFIELDATSEKDLQSIHILRYIKTQQHIPIINWDRVDITNQNIRKVTYYLEAIESDKIKKADIAYEEVEISDPRICSKLIKEKYFHNHNSDFINWHQVSIITTILNQLFRGFSSCSFFLITNIDFSRKPNPRDKKMIETLIESRFNILQALLQSAEQFTSFSIKNRRIQQNAVENDEKILLHDGVVRWETFKPFTVIFTSTFEPLFVYRKPSDVPHALKQYLDFYSKMSNRNSQNMNENVFPDYNTFTHENLFIKLTEISRKYYTKQSICLNCFKQYPHDEDSCGLCFQNLAKPHPEMGHESIKEFQRIVARKLGQSYVITADSFVKMLLIYVRAQCGLPILIMGETGCGKTSLIRCLCEKILDHHLEVFQIHAGITAEQIVQKMSEYRVKADELSKQNKSIWIFFDEFNTTNNIGLLKEIICERTLRAQPLPANMVFLGACNPRRVKTKKLLLNDEMYGGLRKYHYEIAKSEYVNDEHALLYRVVPIPETMLNYIWDYGYLNESTQITYIRTMLQSCKGLSDDEKLYQLTIELIMKSQTYFQELEDVSSVSLRDIARFCKLYNWFYDSFENRMKTYPDGNVENPKNERASFIALLLCYYFRLNTDELRGNYIKRMQGVLIYFNPKLKGQEDYLTKVILEQEQNDLIIGRMELPDGTAKNKALLDNIFVLLVCIVNRIPVFLCGKPGSSKTSSVQILLSNLKGKRSKDPYFQTLPELVTVSFQGSQNCTSESINKVFERARGYSSAKSDSDILPVIVFDEIGLAELSPHNPLKVLHSELEIENAHFGFVGISNWRLDASKMNRSLYLSTPELTVEDLILTGKEIFKSLQKNNNGGSFLKSGFVEALAEAYLSFQEELKSEQSEQRFYFGLRDYYCLIKGIAHDLNADDEAQDFNEIVRIQLELNFGFMEDAPSLLWQRYCQSMNRAHFWDKDERIPFNRILENALNNRSGRYLMLIGDEDYAIDYTERFIQNYHQAHEIPVRTLVGSTFPNDLAFTETYTEQYSDRVLMDIILTAETRTTLIMRQMGHIHDNLYDLFNQSFAVSGKNKYCRIPLGAVYHPRCFIHDDFFCIVLIHKRDIEKCDPPFLNRFQKHLIDIHSLIHPQQLSLARSLHSWVEGLIPKKLGNNFPAIKHLFVNFGKFQSLNLILEAFDELKINISNDLIEEDAENILKSCERKLLRLSTSDLPWILSLNLNEENQCLFDEYFSIRHELTLESVIQQSLDRNSKIELHIIYTYTQIFENISPASENVKFISLSAFKTENELTECIRKHYRSSSEIRLLLIRADYHHDYQHFLSLKHTLKNEHDPSSDRGVWIILHLQRNLMNQQKYDVSFLNTPSYMIEDLNNGFQLSKNVFQEFSYTSLISQTKMVNPSHASIELIDRCFSRFHYIPSTGDRQEEINPRRLKIFNKLVDSSDSLDQYSLLTLIQRNLNVIINQLQKSKTTENTDWRQDLMNNPMIIAGSRSFSQALVTAITCFYEKYLLILINHMETYNFFDSYMNISNMQQSETKSELFHIWLYCFNHSLEKLDIIDVKSDMIQMPVFFDTYLPCTTLEYKNIRIVQEELEQLKRNNSLLNNRNKYLIDRMKNISVYGEDNFTKILENNDLFNFYLQDQMYLFLSDVKIRLPPDFVKKFLCNNRMQSTEEKLCFLLSDMAELTEILRIIEFCSRLVSIEQITDIIEKQEVLDVNTIISSSYYRLMKYEDVLYQLRPRCTQVTEDMKCECDGDPMVEITLMNLIEIIVKEDSISSTKSIQELKMIFGIIEDTMKKLASYNVNNLEKLQYFLCLIRYLTIVLPDDDSLFSFKKETRSPDFHNLAACNDIHNFVQNLSQRIAGENVERRKPFFDELTSKLEIELLKNWLADQNESYCEILNLIQDSTNNLWRYSAKIFVFLDMELDLYDRLITSHGILKIEQNLETLNAFLESLTDSKQTVQHLMVDRLYMRLMRTVGKHNVVQILSDGYPYFEQNIENIIRLGNKISLQTIYSLSWLKYYWQCYAFALHLQMRYDNLKSIDEFLTTKKHPFVSTIKVFIVKHLLNLSGQKVDDIWRKYENMNIFWIKPLIDTNSSHESQSILQDIVLPIPIFHAAAEFIHVSEVLTRAVTQNDFQALIKDCSKSHRHSYAFTSWFINNYYQRFAVQNSRTDSNFSQWITSDFSSLLQKSFTTIGHQFLVSLCTNFTDDSYFRLQSNMKPIQIKQRLVALSIVGLLISLRSMPKMSTLGRLLFDQNNTFPGDYVKHLSGIYVPGLIDHDPIVVQMIDVRTQVQERLKCGVIHKQARFIYQCSSQCQWVFYFENCGVPNDKRTCPICKRPIGAERYGVLIERDPPQIKMSIDDGFKKIAEYIRIHNEKLKHGYSVIQSPTESNSSEKPEHLNRPVSYRFIHLLTHSLLHFLYDSKYINENDCKNILKISSPTFFRDHFEKDFEILMTASGDDHQGYIWLFQLIHELLDEKLTECGLSKNEPNTIKLERNIEEEIISRHSLSIPNEIAAYKQAFTQLMGKPDDTPRIRYLLEETKEDENHFPLLNYFNVTNFHTSNLLGQFKNALDVLPHANQICPITALILERLDDYSNIQYLHPIVQFSNYLIEKLNHRITRDVAATRNISYYLNNDTDDGTMKTLFENFLEAWYSITLSEIQYDCHRQNFHRNLDKEDFAAKTSIATLLLNLSKDASSLVLAACLKTLGMLQNHLVNSLNNLICDPDLYDRKKNTIQLQSIQNEHIIVLSRTILSNELFNRSIVINYNYGNGRDIVYDYNEVEVYLRNLVSSAVLIDTEKLNSFSYQFELYTENASLINEVRARYPQEGLNEIDKDGIKNIVRRIPNDDALNLLGSLDYIFTFLRNTNSSSFMDTATIQYFIENHTHVHVSLRKSILNRPPFSLLELRYILELYDIAEQHVFDKVLRPYLKKELLREKVSAEERQKIVNLFSSNTFTKNTIANSLKNHEVWITMLKRLIVRVLNANVSLEVPLQIYIERSDLWNPPVFEADLNTFEVDSTILLQDTFLILTGLEEKCEQSKQSELTYIQGIMKQQDDIDTVFNQLSEPNVYTKPTDSKTRNKKKLRV